MRSQSVPIVFLLSVACLATADVAGAELSRQGQAISASPHSTPRLPTRWWRDEVVVAQIVLTPAQTKRINAIFEEFLPVQRDKWNALRPLEIELDDLLRQPHADEHQAIDLITRIENRSSELTRRRQIMLFRIQQVLTVKQRDKLAELGGPGPASRR